MRINLVAGPGASKSTAASFIFNQLKKRHFSIELVTEFVKKWVYYKRPITEFDQYVIAASQLQSEYEFLCGGVKNIVTDSPVILAPIYARFYHKTIQISDHLQAIAEEYEKYYPGIYIYLDRGDRVYDPNGRYQSREEAIEIDKRVLERLEKMNCPKLSVHYTDEAGMLDFVLKHIDK